MIEIHHFTHNKTAALSLEGENLYFTSSIKLHLDTSKKDCEIAVPQDTAISRQYIVIQKESLPLPSEFSESSDNGTSNAYEETAHVHLFTHFGDFEFRDVKVRHKVLLLCLNTMSCDMTITLYPFIRPLACVREC
jgi:hypothetical protein